MYDESHVRLVYAHTECYCGDDDVYVFHEEPVLVVRAGLGVQTGMVWSCLDAVYVQKFCELFDLLAAETVDDAGLAGILLYVLDYVSLRV